MPVSLINAPQLVGGKIPADQLPPSSGSIPGEIRLLPFRPSELPAGWYHANGASVLLTSPQGIVLNSLPPGYKTDWKVTITGSSISLPSLMHSDGRLCFVRPVDGSSRLPGAVEGDAIRNITGQLKIRPHADNSVVGPVTAGSGAFNYTKGGGSPGATGMLMGGTGNIDLVDFDASSVVPTANENRVLNIGMTPAIYLGV